MEIVDRSKECKKGYHLWVAARDMARDRVTVCRFCGINKGVYEASFKGQNCGSTGESVNFEDSSKPVDPKQSQASKKMSFDNVPVSLLAQATFGADDGASKYGQWNWLKLEDGSMSLMTYINALQRHLTLYRAGQDNTSDTGIHNLRSMVAGLAVVLDGLLFGKVKDDRCKLSEEQIVILEKLINREIK